MQETHRNATVILSPEENYKIGLELYQRFKYQEAVIYFELSATEEYPAAYSFLRIMYQDGLGVPKNKEKSNHFSHLTANNFVWFQEQAKTNSADAQYHLGFLYRHGLGLEQNDEEAFKCYKLSADQGDAIAQNTLAGLYGEGSGVERDSKNAFKYYKLSADQGDAIAQSNLGYLYENGLGVERDFKEAFKYYKLSADQGVAIAQNNLGYLLYENGLGVERDFKEAFKYFKLSADQGDEDAQNNLTDLYKEISERLYSAILNDDLAAADAENLLSAGVPLSAIENKSGRTPLHQAVKRDNAIMVKLLLCYGADIDASDNKGRVPRDLNPDCFDKAWILIHKANVEKAMLFLEFSVQKDLCEDVVKIILLTMTVCTLQTRAIFLEKYNFLTAQARGGQFIAAAKKFIEKYDSFFSFSFFDADESKKFIREFRAVISSTIYSDIEKESFAKQKIDDFIRCISIETQKEKLKSESKFIDDLLEFKLIDQNTLKDKYGIVPLGSLTKDKPSPSESMVSKLSISSFSNFLTSVVKPPRDDDFTENDENEDENKAGIYNQL